MSLYYKMYPGGLYIKILIVNAVHDFTITTNGKPSFDTLPEQLPSCVLFLMPPILPGAIKNSQYITNNRSCNSNDVTNLSVNDSKLYNIAAPTNDATQSLLLYTCSMYRYTTHTPIYTYYT